MKKVTLSMPVYNVARFVEKSLLSALNQTYNNIEFLIIDDKSTDESMNIVRQVINSHPRKSEVRVIDHIVNKGLGDTRNTSIIEATGDYIYFMDSDDVITPDCIERLVAYMNETPVDFIASSRVRQSFDGKTIAKDVYAPAIVNGNSELDVVRFRYVENHKILAEVWNKLYDLSFLRQHNIQCIPGVHVEDVSFSFQTNLAAKTCRLVPDITYSYHIYEGQSFAAFNTDRKRALYLADCFCKIRERDCEIALKYKDRAEYGAILSAIYNVTLLHSNMVRKAKALSSKDKRQIFSRLLAYNSGLMSTICTKTNKKKNCLYYFVSKMPYSMQNCILKIIYKG